MSTSSQPMEIILLLYHQHANATTLSHPGHLHA